jgi:hypothetical protein
MADPITVTMLALVASKALEGAGGEAGKSAWSGLGRLASVVRRKLSRNRAAEGQLDRVTSGIGTPDDRALLAAIIEDHIRTDAAFREELLSVIADAQRDTAAPQFLTTIANGGKVDKIANIGHVQGNVEF